MRGRLAGTASAAVVGGDANGCQRVRVSDSGLMGVNATLLTMLTMDPLPLPSLLLAGMRSYWLVEKVGKKRRKSKKRARLRLRADRICFRFWAT